MPDPEEPDPVNCALTAWQGEVAPPPALPPCPAGFHRDEGALEDGAAAREGAIRSAWYSMCVKERRIERKLKAKQDRCASLYPPGSQALADCVHDAATWAASELAAAQDAYNTAVNNAELIYGGCAPCIPD